MLVTEVGRQSEIVTDGECGYAVKPDSEYIAAAILDYFENNRKDIFTEGVKGKKKNSPGTR
jgi:glycosyltransferase involved in cell wall biosynthesis